MPLTRIDTGGEESVSVKRPSSCPECRGTGVEGGGAPETCKTCQGTGRKILSQRHKGGVHYQQIVTCPDCRGKGTHIEKPCPECGGEGRVEKEEHLTVQIPAGAEEGMALRIPGHGLPSLDVGGVSGDLYVIVRSRQDPRFERLGADLWRSETLEVADAVLGTHRCVPTLHGTLEVKIPPGTQPDEVLRLRGKGLPVFGGDRHGNLNIRVEVHIPENPSRRERQLYEQLRSLGKKREHKWFRK